MPHLTIDAAGRLCPHTATNRCECRWATQRRAGDDRHTVAFCLAEWTGGLGMPTVVALLRGE
jgi:hypothetical protein